MERVTTRFPPSPTGYLHIGGVRTALFNYLFAANAKGKMMFRFEDTDTARSKKEFEDDILEALEWLEIPYEWPAMQRQSERLPVYQKHFQSLMDKGLAYEAEPSESDPAKRVIRFKNPNVQITFNDLVRGEVTFNTEDLKDFVIARSIDEPLYHLAVVIDDHEMGITHVLRGEEHISNTPRQILILEALGFQRPQYAHIPLILAPDRTKLSKRHGAVSANEYRTQGFLPEALINYLALLGWNPGTEQELFTMDELVEAFDISRIQKSGAIFDLEKLRWFNRQYLLQMREDDFAAEALRRLEEGIGKRGIAYEENVARKVLTIVRERISIWSELDAMIEAGELDFAFIDPPINAQKLPGKGSDAASAAQHLQKVHEVFSKISEEDFNDPEKLKAAIWEYATDKGRAAVLWPTRFALTGLERSPDPFTSASIIGKFASLRRLSAASGNVTSV